MKQYTKFLHTAVLATSALGLGAASISAGEVVPMPAPVPECGTPGWTFTAAALYLKSYQASSSESLESWEGGTYDGDFDWGFRGSIGYERPDGLFFRLVGFWWEGDHDYKYDGRDSDERFTPRVGGKTKAYSFDLLVGDTFCPTENTSIEISAGLRYAKLEQSTTWDDVNDGFGFRGTYDTEFDGWGPTLQIRTRRTLTDRWGLYADFQQSFLFGESELRDREGFFEDGDEEEFFDDKFSSDSLAAISEIRGGIEYLWGWNRIQNAYVRLGAEGQYWWVDSEDLGLVGGHLEVGFTF